MTLTQATINHIEATLTEYIDYSGQCDAERETPESAFDYITCGDGRALRHDAGISLDELEEWEKSHYKDWERGLLAERPFLGAGWED